MLRFNANTQSILLCVFLFLSSHFIIKKKVFVEGGETMKRTVITVSREYASGGREVARLLAEKLNIPFYDKELMTYLAKESGIDKELFMAINEKISFANFYFGDAPQLRKGAHSLRDLGALSLVQRIQEVQEKLIRNLANESCVIVGRCSDYILKDDPDVISIFLRANLVDKKKRAVNEYGESIENVNERLMQVDMKRANYYNYFTDRVWGKANNYDLILSTSTLGLEKSADLLCAMIQLKNKREDEDCQ